MSKDNEKKFVDIEDPLAFMGLDSDNGAEEAAEAENEVFREETKIDTEAETDSLYKEVYEGAPSVSFREKIAAIKNSVSEKFAPIVNAVEKKVSVKNAAIILGSVALVAVVAAVLIFALYSGATYTSGKSVEQWAEDWNAISFSDSCNYMFYSTYSFTADLEAMMISDTDHVYIDESDIKALKNGKTVSIFDDTATVSIETHKGDFHSATLTIDYHELFGKYFGRDYAGDSFVYSPNAFEDSTMRVLAYMAMMINSLNDNLNTEDECLTAACDIFVVSGNAYYDSDGNYMLNDGDYTYTLSYSTEPRTVTVSATDVSSTDASATDTSAVTEITEDHLIVTFTAKHTLSGEKKHAADWSWWDELFPKKEESDNNISGSLSEQVYDTNLSESDADELSETDLSETDY